MQKKKREVKENLGVMTDARIQFVSLVDKPANKRPFLLKKAKGKSRAKTPILKTDEEAHYVTGVVYEPDVFDTDGDTMSAAEIEKAAHWYMLNARGADVNHSGVQEEGAAVVESYIAPQDIVIGENEVKKGAWVMVQKVTDPELWKKVKDGEITGFSIGGICEMQRDEKKKSLFKRLFEKHSAKKSDGGAEAAGKALEALRSAVLLEDGTLADEEAMTNAVSAFLEAMDDIYRGAEEQTKEAQAETEKSITPDDIRAIVEAALDAKLTEVKPEKAPEGEEQKDADNIAEVIEAVIEEKLAPISEAVKKAYNAKDPSNLNGSEQLNKADKHYLSGIL